MSSAGYVLLVGFTGTAPPRTPVLTVATVNGAVTVGAVRHAKARVWLLEDRTLVLCLPDRQAPGRVRREALTGSVVASVWQERAKALTVTLTPQEGDGPTVVTVDARGCGCGMGAAGNAGPVPGAYDVVRVRRPDWHTVEP